MAKGKSGNGGVEEVFECESGSCVSCVSGGIIGECCNKFGKEYSYGMEVVPLCRMRPWRSC